MPVWAATKDRAVTEVSLSAEKLWLHCYGSSSKAFFAGKTYTLSNMEPDAIGMTPRALADIFNKSAIDVVNETRVFMSYCQIYMEVRPISYPGITTCPSRHLIHCENFVDVHICVNQYNQNWASVIVCTVQLWPIAIHIQVSCHSFPIHTRTQTWT